RPPPRPLLGKEGDSETHSVILTNSMMLYLGSPPLLAGTTPPPPLSSWRNPWSGTTLISTRRFCARPSGVSLVAIGRYAPTPRVLTRVWATPSAINSSATAFARRRDRSRFDSSPPRLSVCPVICTRVRG